MGKWEVLQWFLDPSVPVSKYLVSKNFENEDSVLWVIYYTGWVLEIGS